MKSLRFLGLAFALSALLPACKKNCYVCTHPLDTDCTVEICGGNNTAEVTATNCTIVLENDPPVSTLLDAYEAVGYTCTKK